MEKSAIISFRAIGTQEGSLLYQSSLLGRLVHGKKLSCTILERAASSSRGFHQKKAIRNPDGLWSGKRDLNSRPRPWQGRALPTELFPQTCYPQHCFGITKVVLFSFPANFFRKISRKISKLSKRRFVLRFLTSKKRSNKSTFFSFRSCFELFV